MAILHTIPPVIDESSKILILGSFPSVKSRETGFYYGHPRNRFWPVMESLFGKEIHTIDEKKSFLISHHIALSDVILSCEIKASEDASITEVIPNDIASLIAGTRVRRIFLNGGKAYELYLRHNRLDIEAVRLPSTSPANASWSLEKLLAAWSVVKDALRC